MRRISNVLLYAGAGICILGAIGMAGGMWVNLPPEAVRVIAMALPFILGGVLLLTGAVVGRAARRADLPAGSEDPRVGADTPDWAAPSREAETATRPGTKHDDERGRR